MMLHYSAVAPAQPEMLRLEKDQFAYSPKIGVCVYIETQTFSSKHPENSRCRLLAPFSDLANPEVYIERKFLTEHTNRDFALNCIKKLYDGARDHQDFLTLKDAETIYAEGAALQIAAMLRRLHTALQENAFGKSEIDKASDLWTKCLTRIAGIATAYAVTKHQGIKRTREGLAPTLKVFEERLVTALNGGINDNNAEHIFGLSERETTRFKLAAERAVKRAPKPPAQEPQEPTFQWEPTAAQAAPQQPTSPLFHYPRWCETQWGKKSAPKPQRDLPPHRYPPGCVRRWGKGLGCSA